MLRVLLRNSASNVAILFLKIAVKFIMAPVILLALGNRDYGIWEITMAVLGYAGMLDIGIQPAIVTYSARHIAKNDTEKLKEVFSSSLVFAIAMGAVVSAILFAGAFAVPYFMDDPGSSPLKYTYFLIIIAIQALGSFPGRVFEAFHNGFQRYHMTTAITAVNVVLGAVIMYFLLGKGYGLFALASVNTAGLLLKYFFFACLLMKPQFGGLRFHWRDFNFAEMKSLLVFGAKNFFLTISNLLSQGTDSIVIGFFLGAAKVPFFTFPANLLGMIKETVNSITLGFIPYFSGLSVKDKRNDTRSSFLIASRYTVGLSCCALLAAGWLGGPFLARWVGKEYAEKGRWVLYIMLAAHTANLLNPFSARFLISQGAHGLLARIRLVEAFANLALSVSLVNFVGIEGAALGTLAPALIVEPLVLRIVCRTSGVGLLGYVRSAVLPFLLPVLATSCFYWAAATYFSVVSYAEILGAGLTGSAIFLFIGFWISIPKDERTFILKAVGARWGSVNS